jgi:Uma2 family endonuclease
MTAAISYIPREKTYTLEKYLVREERALHKHEFHNGKIIRMPGGKAKHSEISTNITHAIKLDIKNLDKKYRVYNSDLKIYVEAENKALYPDALVICEAPQYWNGREDLITNPLLIVEVASKSTKGYDRGDKFMSYRKLDSFQEYVLVSQDEPFVEVFFRQEKSTWNISDAKGLGETIYFHTLGINISLSDIYENIEFIKK